MSATDTIFALSSGSGRAGIAVWRISGPKAAQILCALTRQPSPPAPRHAVRAHIYDDDGGMIDDGLVLWFPGPRSVTGDDLAECHLHGSLAVGERFTRRLMSLGGAPADAGAFTRRAFANGKMDLLEVEGLGELLAAETDLQHRQAIAVMGGAAARQADEWGNSLIDALAVLEAAVDFPDEDDIPENVAERAIPLIHDVVASLRHQLAIADKGRRLREGTRLAIVGPPNAGKSTLLNRLLGEERAIVSDIPGTTRDIVSARLSLSGRLIEVLDTAGWRSSTDDPVERIGIDRAVAAAKEADIVLAVRDAAAPEDIMSPHLERLSGRVIRVANKIDMPLAAPSEDEIAISAHSGKGWNLLIDQLITVLEDLAAPALFSHVRQRMLLTQGIERLEAVSSRRHLVPELMAEDIRSVLVTLDQLVGKVTTEDVLGRIFSGFCVGK